MVKVDFADPRSGDLWTVKLQFDRLKLDATVTVASLNTGYAIGTEAFLH